MHKARLLWGHHQPPAPRRTLTLARDPESAKETQTLWGDEGAAHTHPQSPPGDSAGIAATLQAHTGTQEQTHTHTHPTLTMSAKQSKGTILGFYSADLGFPGLRRCSGPCGCPSRLRGLQGRCTPCPVGAGSKGAAPAQDLPLHSPAPVPAERFGPPAWGRNLPATHVCRFLSSPGRAAGICAQHPLLIAGEGRWSPRNSGEPRVSWEAGGGPGPGGL